MNRPVSFSEMTDSLMELADTFGIFASLFTREQRIREVHWQDGGFRLRKNGASRSLCVTVQTADSRVGQAWTENWSLSSVQRCFHHARNHARGGSPLLAAMHELARQERRLPALSTEGSEPEWVELVPRHIDVLHRQAASRISPYSLSTTLRFIEEQVHSFRSDGMNHSVRFSRLLTDHLSCDPLRTTSHRMRTGITLSPCAEWDMPQHLDALTEQTEWFIRQLPNTSMMHPASFSTPLSVDSGPFWLDMELLAMMVVAWTKSRSETGASRATIRAIALDGSPGYFPIHPWGYLFPPLTLLSPAGAVPAHLHIIRNDPDFSNLLTVQLPLLREQVSHPHELFELAENGALLLEGADWFSFDEQTGLCCFLPRRVSTRDGDRSPVMFEMPLHQVMESLWAGAGGSVTAWGAPDSLWTVTGPRFVYVQPTGGK
jgi:hypothetical protein